MAPSVRMDKPWLELTAANVHRLGGHLGVYELATAAGEVVLVGCAGGRAAFGLRGELERELGARGEGAALFRTEVTMAYLSRYRELLMAHLADHGRLPAENPEDPAKLGRLSPS